MYKVVLQLIRTLKPVSLKICCYSYIQLIFTWELAQQTLVTYFSRKDLVTKPTLYTVAGISGKGVKWIDKQMLG